MMTTFNLPINCKVRHGEHEWRVAFVGWPGAYCLDRPGAPQLWVDKDSLERENAAACVNDEQRRRIVSGLP